MYLYRLLKRLFLYPPFFIPVLMVIGAFEAATNPSVVKLLNTTALKIWTPEAAPRIFDYTTYALMVIAGSSLAASVYGWWRSGVPTRAVRRAHQGADCIRADPKAKGAP